MSLGAGRILIAGDFRPGRLGASYERAFRTLGLDVDRFDITVERAFLSWSARNRWVHRLSIRSLAARRTWSRRYNCALLDRCRASSVPWVLLHNADWVMPETVRALRAEGRIVAVHHADNPFPPHYNNRPETLPAAAVADIYFVWSKRLAAKLKGAGINGHFLAFGWDPEVFPYQGSIAQGGWPGAVFIGNWDREREQFLDEVSVHVPLRIYGSAYWATRTKRSSLARRAWQGGELTMGGAAEVLRESAVSLNILRTQHQIDGEFDGVIMRHFEVPGAGGVLLSTRSGVATELFEPGRSGLYFSSVKECVDECHRLIADPQSRVRLSERAHALVAGEHTYVHRAREIADAMAALSNPLPVPAKTAK